MKSGHRFGLALVALAVVGLGCGGGGSSMTQLPTMMASLKERYHEGWLASPAVADLDRDGMNEVVIARAGRLLTFRPDGAVKGGFDVPGRICGSPPVRRLLRIPRSVNSRAMASSSSCRMKWVRGRRGMPSSGMQ